MTAIRAWRDGIRRVVSAPSVLVAAWAMTTAAAVPLTLAIRADIAASLTSRVDADAAAQGMHYEWMLEFSGRASGLAATFRPTIVGFAAVLDNLSALLDNTRRPAAVMLAAAVYALVWMFLSGGVITRYRDARLKSSRYESSRSESSRAESSRSTFLGNCTAYFFRFVRLGLAAAIVYFLLFSVLHPWLFAGVYPRLARGASEPSAFAIRAAFYGVFLLLLASVNIVFDYAKVRAVIEDRRSMTMALVASGRFIARHPAAAIGVYLLDGAVFLLGLAAYSYLAPPGGGIGVMAWAAFAIGQIYIAGRLAVRLLFFASETTLVESTVGSRQSQVD